MTPLPTRSLALVTGASSGIGRELATQFAEHDFDPQALRRKMAEPGSGDDG